MKRSLGEINRNVRMYLWGDHGLTLLLILLFPAMFATSSIDTGTERIIFGFFFTLLLVSGVSNISTRLLPRIAAGLLAAVTIAIHWLHNFNTDPRLAIVASTLSLLCFLVLSFVILKKVFQDGPVTVSKIKGAIGVYILIGFSWSFIYQLIDLQIAGAFNIPPFAAASGDVRHSTDLTYFSFTTLTTLGYGDITPTHSLSRMFAILEGLIGQLYPATLLARLVSLEIMHREKKRLDLY